MTGKARGLKGKWRNCVTALLFVLAASTVTRAEDAPLRILSSVIPGMINADGSGFYVRLLRRAWETDTLRIEVLPTKRALRSFSDASEATCFIPLSRKTAMYLELDTRGKVFSKAFNSSFSTIISQRGSAPARSLHAVKGRTVGVQLGFPIADEVVEAAAHVSTPTSLESLLKMLELGRIDFAYVHYPDVALSYANHGISPFPESELRFQIVPEALACTDDATDWVRRFDASVDRMYQNDTIRDILGASYSGR